MSESPINTNVARDIVGRLDRAFGANGAPHAAISPSDIEYLSRALAELDWTRTERNMARKEAAHANVFGGREGEEKFFVTGDIEQPEPLTLEGLHRAIGEIWDGAAGDDGWPDGVSELTVWRAVPISRAVLVREAHAVPCETCCGGEIEEHLADGICPTCDGTGEVWSDDLHEPWKTGFDAVSEYEMRPPLPPLEGKGG